MENSEDRTPSTALEIGEGNLFQCPACGYRCLNSDERQKHYNLCHKETSSTICNEAVSISNWHSSQNFNEGSSVVDSQDLSVKNDTCNFASTVAQDKQIIENNSDANAAVHLASRDSDAEQKRFTLQPSVDVHSTVEQVKVLPSSACSSLECAVDIDLTIEGNEVGPSSNCFSPLSYITIDSTEDCAEQNGFIARASNALMSKKAEVEAIMHTENSSMNCLLNDGITAAEDFASKSTPSLVPQVFSLPNQDDSRKSLDTGEQRVGIVYPVITAITCTVTPTARNTSSTSSYSESDGTVLQSSSGTVSAVEPTNEPDSLPVNASEGIATLPTYPHTSSSSGNVVISSAIFFWPF
ncbi:hypothetical protein TTRE_0000647901 [Trichuris trichiura]|uniref:C2H2-type domain-containing protein n=1 Tax=Trichuris trichiura TaxID=36087 RepID=A0A077ZEC5_TRITR|nr:hypothetical protein TTRE_0000647901 [Trichuris trichiura]